MHWSLQLTKHRSIRMHVPQCTCMSAARGGGGAVADIYIYIYIYMYIYIFFTPGDRDIHSFRQLLEEPDLGDTLKVESESGT